MGSGGSFAGEVFLQDAKIAIVIYANRINLLFKSCEVKNL
jgi:hypothetical protein